MATNFYLKTCEIIPNEQTNVKYVNMKLLFAQILVITSVIHYAINLLIKSRSTTLMQFVVDSETLRF